MSRSETLTRLRAALQGRMSPELPEALPAFPRFEDPVAVFCERLTVSGGIVLDSRCGRRESRLRIGFGQEPVIDGTTTIV